MTTNFRDRFDLFVFDLDGTLVDSGRDIAASLNHALGTLGLGPLSYEDVLQCVGRGARVLLERALTRSDASARHIEAKVESGLAAFLAHYREECIRRTTLHDGVEDALDGLSRSARLAVHTNKPGPQCHRILSHLSIHSRFQGIVDGDGCLQRGDEAPAALDLRRKPAPDGLIALAQELGCSLERVLLIGDTSTDLQTARAAGSAVALVPYGFENEADWGERPDYRLSSLRDLLGASNG